MFPSSNIFISLNYYSESMNVYIEKFQCDKAVAMIDVSQRWWKFWPVLFFVVMKANKARYLATLGVLSWPAAAKYSRQRWDFFLRKLSYILAEMILSKKGIMSSISCVYTIICGSIIDTLSLWIINFEPTLAQMPSTSRLSGYPEVDTWFKKIQFVPRVLCQVDLQANDHIECGRIGQLFQNTASIQHWLGIYLKESGEAQLKSAYNDKYRVIGLTTTQDTYICLFLNTSAVHRPDAFDYLIDLERVSPKDFCVGSCLDLEEIR